MKSLKILAVLLTAMLLVQCQDESIEDAQQGKEIIPEEIMKGLDNMGIDTKNFEVLKKKDGYLVEGDIIVNTETILDAAKTTTAKHTRVRTIVRCGYAKDIKVYNDIPEINVQVRNAMNDWTRVSGSFLRFRFVNSREASDIAIFRDPGNFGAGTFPRPNGLPGDIILIDPSKYNVISNPGKRGRIIRFVIRHEIGHNVGFAHTNKNEGGTAFIPGSPNRDANSAMNAQRLDSQGTPRGFQQGNLSQGDIKALRKMYGPGYAQNLCF